MPNMRVAVLTRVSTDEQLKHGISLSVQAETCRVAALRAGATEIVLFEDGGYSGTTLKRPALTDLRSRLPEFAVIYVYKLDRLCRNVKAFADLMQEFSDAGVGFVSVTEGISYTGAASRLTMHMLSAAAAFFADINKERVKDALRHRVEIDGRPHGPAPYGYARDPAGHYVPREDEARYVRELFKRYAGGESLNDLALWMVSAGAVPRRNATSWQATQVRCILSNPTYTGALHWHGTTYPGHHDPLVSAATWRKVQARLVANRSIPPQSRRSSLASLLTCGYCGKRIIRTGSHGGTYPGYKCGTRRFVPPEDRHPPVHVSAPVLEEALWRYAQHYLGEDLAQGLADGEEARRKAAAGSALPDLRKALRALEQRQALLLRGYSLGSIPEDVYTAEAAPLAAERTVIIGKLEATEPPPAWKELHRLAAQPDPTRAIRNARGKPGDVQVAFLRVLFPLIEVYPRRLVIHHAAGEPSVELTLPRRYPGRVPFLLDGEVLE